MKTNFKYTISEEPKKFNLVGLTPNLPVESIPTLLPEKKLKAIQAGDPEPYYKIQEIDITEPANGMHYLPEFWNSYLNKLKDRPYPGSKDGHHVMYGERPPTDFYLIGGKLSNDNKKVYLKNYIPPEGDTTPNIGFIRDLKAGIVHFSVVAYTKDKIYLNEDGSIEKIEVVESIRGERNDAVEFGMGAMDQKVNNKTTPDKNGVEKNNTEVNNMTFKECMETLGNLKTNGDININQIAEALKIPVVTEEHEKAVNVVGELKKKLNTDNIVETVNTLVANSEKVTKDTFDLLRNKKMTEVFGPEKIEDKENLKRNAAEMIVTKDIVDEKELDKQIDAAKLNSVVQSFSYAEADITTESNDISGIDKKVNKDKDESKEFVTL